jgi:uncharacterized membrane protein
MQGKNGKQILLVRLSGLQKLFIAIAGAVTGYGLLLLSPLHLHNRLILTWDVFCLCMICFSWIVFHSTNEHQISKVCDQQDDGLEAIFSIVLVAILVSLFGTVLLITGTSDAALGRVPQAVISLSPVLLSWFLLHTLFTVRYAHLYNDEQKLDTISHKGGLDFPGKQAPDYIDFAYFSFVIGMTFQVSDVQITSRSIRRFVLMHSLISFGFNTAIVALTINAIVGLKK